MHGLLSPRRLARALWVNRMLRGLQFMHGLNEFEGHATATLRRQVRYIEIANGFNKHPESVQPEAEEMQIPMARRQFLLLRRKPPKIPFKALSR